MAQDSTLIDLLSPERLIVTGGDVGKWGLIDELVDCLPLGDGYQGDLELARNAVHARENQMTTGLEAGVALPHGLLPPPVETRAALAVCPGGLSFDSLDGEPTHFVLLMVLGDDKAGRDRHLLSLSQAVSLFTGEVGRRTLLEAESTDALWAALHTLTRGP